MAEKDKKQIPTVVGVRSYMMQQNTKGQKLSYGGESSHINDVSNYAARIVPNQTFYNGSTKVKPNCANSGVGVVVNRNLVVKLDQKGNQMTQGSLNDKSQILSQTNGYLMA